MKHLFKRSLAVLCVLAMLVGIVPMVAAEGEAPKFEFAVLSTTDMHGRCWDKNILNDTDMNNSMLNVATGVAQYRETYGDNLIVIDNGDTYQGTPVSTLQISEYTQGLTTDPNPMALAMRYIGYDLCTVGNHEFNYAWNTMNDIYKYLESNVEGLKKVVPACANLYYEDGTNVLDPYMIKTLKNENGDELKVAILAFVTPDCTRWDVPDNYPGMRFTHPENPYPSIRWEAEKWVKEIEEKENPDFVVVTFHSGTGASVEDEDLVFGVNTEGQVTSMIAGTTGIDMVIAGHDHSAGYSNTFIKNADGEDVLVVNGAGNALTASEFEVDAEGNVSLKQTVDEDGKLVYVTENKALKDYDADETLKAMIKPYADKAIAYVEETCGVATGEWNKTTKFYLEQSDTIDLIGRAQIAQGTIHLEEKFDTEEKKAALFAETGLTDLTVDASSTSVVVNGGYNVTAGELSMKDIYRMYKYDNSLYLMPVTGAELRGFLEFNAATHLKVITSSGTPVFNTDGDNFTNPIFYGLDFKYDMSREEYDRIIDLKFSDGREVVDDEVYIFAVNNYHLGNASGPFADYGPEDCIWSQTNDMGGGFVQDLIAEFLKAETEKNGGVAPAPSNWEIVYTGEIKEEELSGKYFGELVDPNDMADGDKFMLYYPAENLLMSNQAADTKLAPSDDVTAGVVADVQLIGTNDANTIFTLVKNADGSVSFKDADGKFVTSGETGNSLSMVSEHSACADWTLEATDGGWYVHNVGAAYNGNNNQYLEYYNSVFTTYGLNGGGAIYTYNFYKLTDKVPEEKPDAWDGKITIGGLDPDIWTTKYGNVYTDLAAENFTGALGLSYGDLAKVKFLTHELILPVIPHYSYVDSGKPALLIEKGEDGKPSGYAFLAINMGNFLDTYGIATKGTDEEGNWFWTAKEGVTFPIEVTIELSEKEGYLNDYLIRDIQRTNVREDYPELTDEAFANFREVTTTGMGDGILYRSSSPINPELGRNTYADKAAEKAGIKTFVNLADNEEEAKAYEGFADTYYSKQNVIYLCLGVDFAEESFRKGLAEGLRFMTENEGPYLIHCTEGKDRAGFTHAVLECFMGASLAEVKADYMRTYINYYKVEEGSAQYNAILESNIVKSLKNAFEVDDLEKADLKEEAEEYLEEIGLTEKEIDELFIALGGEEEKPVEPIEFKDVDEKDWHYEYVTKAAAAGLVNGMGNKKFEPDTNMTRAMLVTILYRAEGEPEVDEDDNPFKDVKDGEWYTDAVIWAAENDIVKGMTNTTFEPNTNITREQIAVILFRYAQTKDEEVEGDKDEIDFADANEISSYAREAIAWAVEEEIIEGRGNNKVAPKANATRAEVATVLVRYLGL